MTTETRPGASALWIFLLTAASMGTSFVLSCAMPFAALAALAAVHMHRSDALKLMGLVWLANQFVGFAFLHYPHSLTTYGWGLALGMAAVAALLGADSLLARSMPKTEPARLALAYGGAFVAFKMMILAWALGLGGVETTLDPAIVARQFLRDVAILVGLFIFYHALLGLGVPAPRPRRGPAMAVA